MTKEKLCETMGKILTMDNMQLDKFVEKISTSTIDNKFKKILYRTVDIKRIILEPEHNAVIEVQEDVEVD